MQKAYKDLFETHGDQAWALPRSELVTFFRMSDGTSEIVGTRQASTFEVLASLALKREASDAPKTGQNRQPPPRAPKKPKDTPKEKGAENGTQGVSFVNGPAAELGLSIRIELTLPSTDDSKVYDALFRSLRENLIDPHKRG